MHTTRHQQRSEATRERLLTAAMDFIDRHGMADFSIHALAREAGMTSGAVQHHFASKAVLMLAVLERVIGSLEQGEGLWPPPRWSLRRRADHFCREAWRRIYSQRRFQAAWSAYLAVLDDPALVAHIRDTRTRVGRLMQQRLATTFPELGTGAAGQARAQFVLSALRGLGLVHPFASPAQVRQQLRTLSDYLQSFATPRPGDTP